MQWLKQMANIMRRWCEFHIEVLDSDDGPKYFKKGGLLPPRDLLHRFLFWLVETSEGTIYKSSHLPSETTDNRMVTVRTVEEYRLRLFSAFSYYNEPLDRGLGTNTRNWIMNNLTTRIESQSREQDETSWLPP